MMKSIKSQLIVQIKKIGLLLLIFSVCGILNYHPQMLLGLNSPHWGWIFSLLATILIIFFTSRRDPGVWKQNLGIDFKKNDILKFVIITILFSALAGFIVQYVSMLAGYNFQPKLFFYKTYLGSDYPFHYVLANYLYYIPETFNEEMLIGAFLLLGLERRFKGRSKNYFAIIVALIFSLMHQGLYLLSPVQSGTLLTLTTIVTLFFVGIIRNSLILKTHNIALSWAIHLSFNLVFFSGLFISVKTGKSPVEPEVFNIVFGNLTMLAVTGIFALLSITWLNIDKI